MDSSPHNPSSGDINIPNAPPPSSTPPGLPASRSSTSLTSSSASVASSLLASTAPPSDSSQSEFAPSDHSSSSPAPVNPSKNSFFPIPAPAATARSPSPGHMGQSQSGAANAPSPVSIPSLAPPVSSSASSIASSTGGRFKRAWGRRKKSEDVTAILANAQVSSGKGKEHAVDASSVVSAGSSQPSDSRGRPLLPHIKTSKSILPIQLSSPFNVFSSKKHAPSPKSTNMAATTSQPPPVPKMTEAQASKALPPPPEATSLSNQQDEKQQNQRASVIVSPSTAAAIQLLQVAEEGPAKETAPKDLPPPPLRRPSTANSKPDHETKQDWRKSDSTTISHSTIRAGAFGNRSPRPVSLAESSHSGHTVVPVNRRLSALITDAEFAMPEEGDVSDSNQELTTSALSSRRASPASSLRARNRRSMSLHLVSGTWTPKTKPSTPDEFGVVNNPSESAIIQLHRTYTGTTTSPAAATMDTAPTAAKGIIAPLSPPDAIHSTGSNIRDRLAAWTSTTAPVRRADRPPSTVPFQAPATAQASIRQTTISMSGHSAAGIAIGIGKRAANKVTRVWGGLSSSSSSVSTHSTSSSTSGTTPSSYHSTHLDRSTSEQSMPSHSSTSVWKRRRTPNAPSGSWSVTSSLASSSVTDFDAPSGPNLGTRLRGPKRSASGSYVAGGLVFGRELETCVNDTAINSTLVSREFRTSAEDTKPSRPLEKRLLPALVVRCAQHLHQWGLQEEGLFRLSGRPAHVAKLRSEFDTGADFNLVESDPGDLDPHAVASIFKAYLRELPQPLLTAQLIPQFEAVMTPDAKENKEGTSESSKAGRPRAGSRGPSLPSGPRAGLPLPLRKPPSLSTLAMPSFAGARTLSEDTLLALAGLVAQLPPYNRDLLYTVVELIRATAARVKETKMTLGNLLLVFCPSLNMSPSLLRVLCEAEKIWEEPPKKPADPAVIDIAAPILDIVPTAGDADQSSLSSSQSSNVAENEDLDSESDLVPVSRTGLSTRHPTSTFYATALDIPTTALLDRLSSHSGANDRDSYVSALDGTANTNSTPSSLANSPRVPPLSSSTDSLATPSTMSENPSFSNEVLSRQEPTGKSDQVAVSDPVVADSEDMSLPSPRSQPISSPIPFPSTDGSVPQSTNLKRRKSYNLLSFPPLKSDSSSSAPSTPSSPNSWSRRNSRPSLRILFSKKSSSPLTSPTSASSPPATCVCTTRVYHDRLSAPNAQHARAATAPMLTTDISSSPIRLFASGNEENSQCDHDDALEPPPSIRSRADSTGSSLYSTPQHTPVADRSSLSNALAAADGKYIEPHQFRSPSQASLTPSINLNLEGDAEDDWAESVLAAADRA